MRVISARTLFLFATYLLFVIARSDAEETPIAEFSFDDPRLQITLPVRIGEDTFDFLLDIDAKISAYSAERSWTEKPVGYVNAKTGSGFRKVAIYRRPSSMLGPIKLSENDQVGSLEFTNISKKVGRPVHGILGLDVLKQHIIQLDFESQMVRFLASVPKESGTYHPFASQNSEKATLKFELAGSGFEAQLSTASDREFEFSRTRWDELQRQGHLSRIKAFTDETIGGKTISNEGTLDSIRFGESAFENVDVKDTGNSEAAGLKFLSRFLVTIDFPGKAVYLKPSRYFSKSRPRDASGLGLTSHNHQIVVSSLREGCPAASSGIRKGDVILNVDSKKSDDWDIVDLRGALSVPGKKLTMTIQRDREQLDVSVELADY